MAFIKQFPNVKSLAKASENEVLRTWQGLGYYSRARNLHKCARLVVDQYNGKFPETFDELIQLPGIGHYTASAIASFAFNQRQAVVDGNVFRVLSRYFGVFDDIASGKGVKKFRELALEILPDKNIPDYNQGIMEFGAVQCTPGKPDCSSCILNLECYARLHAAQAQLPAKTQKTSSRVVHFTYFVFIKQGKVWMKQRKENIWQGLYEYLLVEENTDPDKWLQQHGVENHVILNEAEKVHILSHRKIHARFVTVKLNSESLPECLKDHNGFSFSEIENLPKPILIEWHLKDVLEKLEEPS